MPECAGQVIDRGRLRAASRQLAEFEIQLVAARYGLTLRLTPGRDVLMGIAHAGSDVLNEHVVVAARERLACGVLGLLTVFDRLQVVTHLGSLLRASMSASRARFCK